MSLNSPHSSTDDEEVEQFIREAVCGAASEGSTHDAVENATHEAVMKFRLMRNKSHNSRHKGKKRNRAATTSLAEPASETASNSETSPPQREVAVHEF